MKYGTAFFLMILFLFLTFSCKNTNCVKKKPLESASKFLDKRCSKIREERHKIKIQKKVCGPKPEHAEKKCQDPEILNDFVYCSSKPGLKELQKSDFDLKIPADEYYKTLDKCKEFDIETAKLCDALPPPGPDDWVQVSGSGVYRGGKLVSKDGRPFCQD